MSDSNDMQENSSLSKKEKSLLSSILLIIGLFTALDVYEDWIEGAHMSHIIPEVTIIFLNIGMALFLFYKILKNKSLALASTQEELSQAKATALTWQTTAESLKSGVTEAISKQLLEWNLSPAEQEVAFLLLKGLSIQEIADVRGTSERTIRQQASEIYHKSKLSGRAQLSAFFMEDLFDRSGD